MDLTNKEILVLEETDVNTLIEAVKDYQPGLDSNLLFELEEQDRSTLLEHLYEIVDPEILKYVVWDIR